MQPCQHRCKRHAVHDHALSDRALIWVQHINAMLSLCRWTVVQYHRPRSPETLLLTLALALALTLALAFTPYCAMLKLMGEETAAPPPPKT